MTPREVVAGMLACSCGAEGRVKQAWKSMSGMEPPGGADDPRCQGVGRCGKWPWRVVLTEPFQLTEWRQDLIACECGAEGRLVQRWSDANEGDLGVYPLWITGAVASTDHFLKFVLWQEPYCQGCFAGRGFREHLRPWYAVPGVPILLPVEAAVVASLRPQTRRLLSIDG